MFILVGSQAPLAAVHRRRSSNGGTTEAQAVDDRPYRKPNWHESNLRALFDCAAEDTKLATAFGPHGSSNSAQRGDVEEPTSMNSF